MLLPFVVGILMGRLAPPSGHRVMKIRKSRTGDSFSNPPPTNYYFENFLRPRLEIGSLWIEPVVFKVKSMLSGEDTAADFYNLIYILTQFPRPKHAFLSNCFLPLSFLQNKIVVNRLCFCFFLDNKQNKKTFKVLTMSILLSIFLV